MNFSTMNDLALLAIGVGFGLILALVAVMTYSLHSTAKNLRQDLSSAVANLTTTATTSAQSIHQFRNDLTAAISRLDGDRIYAASVSLQRTAKSLAATTSSLEHAVLAQPSSPAIDTTFSGMTSLDEEAADDARMLAERGRWQASSSTSTAYPDPLNPLAGLSEEEKQRRINDFFRQRARQSGQPAALSDLNSFSSLSSSISTSAPPAPGSGAYASLLDLAAQQPPTAKPAPDFSTFEEEGGVDLAGKGELD